MAEDCGCLPSRSRGWEDINASFRGEPHLICTGNACSLIHPLLVIKLVLWSPSAWQLCLSQKFPKSGVVSNMIFSTPKTLTERSAKIEVELFIDSAESDCLFIPSLTTCQVLSRHRDMAEKKKPKTQLS